MSDLSFERLKEIGDRYGVQVEKVSDPSKAGFFMTQADGSNRKLTTDELMEMILPGSMELLSKPSRIDEVKNAMKKLVSDHREAVEDHEDYSQGEADEDLCQMLTQRLNKESFSIKDQKGIPYGGNGGKGDNASLQEIWKIVRDDCFSEQKWIVWDHEEIPCPSNEKDYERFSDFVRYIAQGYKIPYQL